MRILMLLQHPFPPDIRVENEAASLLEAGYEVHLLCTEDMRGAVALPSTLDELVVHALPGTWKQLAHWRRRLMNLPLLWFVNVQWGREIRVLSQQEGRFDAIHVHDLPLVRTGRLAAKKVGANIVADLHENYPMALQFYGSGKSRSLIGRFLRSPRRWERYEMRSIPSCTQVIAVVDEMRSRLIAIGVPDDRVTVVENFVNIEPFLAFPAVSMNGEFDRRFVISYVGGFGRHRGLDTAIRAMRIVVRDVPNALLLLVGDGKIKSDLEDLVAELALESNVRFEGRVGFDRVPSYIAASDVCIIPHVQSVQTDAALPHKLFQYMLLGKPVVASSCAGVQRVIDDAGCGLLFPPGDSEALADALISLTDAGLRERLGERGQAAVRDRYNWSESERKLVGIYERIQSPSETREPAPNA